ncbi:MAG TPA: chemotaxis protein CheW [Tepidisphaeraceae bacterium]
MDDFDLVKEFLVESYENLDRLDQDFIALEIDPTATEKLASIFRTIHTIKGTCGCLGFGKLESVAHVGENLLSRLRDGTLGINTEITTALLKLVDAIREILHSIESAQTEGNGDYSALCATLVRLNQAGTAAEADHAAPVPAAEPIAVSMAVMEAPAAVEVHAVAEAAHPAEDDHAPKAAENAEKKASSGDSVAGNAIRVDVELLDKLMTLVGELVLARNQVLQHTAAQQEPALQRTAQRLNLITTELQEGVMKTRMQPIGNLWNKFPRVVRDVANACGKKVRLEMDGRETELDKTIIEAIKDPLTHVIRNSVDHGVEAPEKRRAAGKPEEGCLLMRAFHEGGQVNIEIIDDGKGIDPAIIKRKAVEKGLITADQAARMSEREAVHLVFAPGFSTAEKITNVSGRGVGMDVVKTNIEKIGGTVDIQSRVGEGTTLRIKIPLTLAIIPALIVTSGGERFAIPQVSLLELVRLEEKEAGIELINGTPLYRLRGNLLPLLYLNRQLKLTNASKASGENIVVLRAGERQFGLVVDQINDTEEIVVKPLGKQLKSQAVFAGTTIMGDGGVALILDVLGIAQSANVMSQHTDANARTAVHQNGAASADKRTLLLFRLRDEERMAVPLSAVARLEEFDRAKIEHAGNQFVVQYRGKIMPLINLSEVLGDRRAKARMSRRKKTESAAAKAQVVVYTHQGQNVGLLVEWIVDVIDEQIDVETSGVRPGVLGTAIIKGNVTELLDVSAIVQKALDTMGPRAAAACELSDDLLSEPVARAA